MTGQASWITAAVLFLGGFGVLLLATVGLRIGTTVRAISRHATCPVKKRDVDLLVLADRRDGHWTDVERCSAFEDPGGVTCAKACLKAHG